MTLPDAVFWPLAAVAFTCLFYFSVLLTISFMRQKRYALMLLSAALMCLCYFPLQGIVFFLFARTEGPLFLAFSRFLVTRPHALILAVIVMAGIVMSLLFRNLNRYEKSSITSMSVKEASDSLPSGICFYVPSGRIIMVNRAMENFCQDTTGDLLINGKLFREKLFSGTIKPDCHLAMVGETPVITLPDGSAWSVTEREASYETGVLHMLLAADVTEIYHKTQELRGMQEKLAKLNARLTEYNRGIVALTAEKELLSARVQLHDEMGADLLSMKRYIQKGGTEEERADIEARLRRNVTFLKTGQTSAVKDEYELMLETAEKLGVHVCLLGMLPQTEPQKHVIATAIHECFTNTIRHAHGTELTIATWEEGDFIHVVIANDGEQPKEEIREKGGLLSLRTLTEYAGGTMTISIDPVFNITLILPKEEDNVIPGFGRG